MIFSDESFKEGRSLATIFSLKEWRTRATAGVGGIAAIIAGWGIGLFEEKDQPPPPTLSVGRPIPAGEWSLRFERVTRSDRLPDGTMVSRFGREAVILYVQATNRTTRSSNSLLQAVTLATSAKGVDARPTAYLIRDHAIMTDLQPGLPEEVALVWTYTAGQTIPSRLRFDVMASNFKPQDNLYAQPLWTDAHKIGVVDLPLQTAKGGGL